MAFVAGMIVGVIGVFLIMAVLIEIFGEGE